MVRKGGQPTSLLHVKRDAGGDKFVHSKREISVNAYVSISGRRHTDISRTAPSFGVQFPTVDSNEGNAKSRYLFFIRGELNEITSV